MIFLVATIAIGPGLIVNIGLKEPRPRPAPGPCRRIRRNGRIPPLVSLRRRLPKRTAPSFPAKRPRLLDGRAGYAARRPLSARALAGALLFGVGASLLRIAFGGHFLSDALLGGLISLIVIVLARRLIWPRGGAP